MCNTSKLRPVNLRFIINFMNSRVSFNTSQVYGRYPWSVPALLSSSADPPAMQGVPFGMFRFSGRDDLTLHPVIVNDVFYSAT